MNMDMTCRGMQYEVGGTYRVDGEVELCRNGLHFCRRLVDVFRHYPIGSSRYFEVEAGGTVVTDKVDGKSAASELTIVRELPEAEVSLCLILSGGRGDGYRDGNSDSHGYGLGYGDGHGDGYGNSYGDGYGDGEGNGYGHGNDDGYGDSNGDGEGNGYGNGNGYGDDIEYILKIKK